MGRFSTRWKVYILAFLVAAVLGLTVRIYAPVVIGELFGANAFGLKFLGSKLLLPALVALVVGYILPKGFYLWGIAAILLHPLVEASSINRALEGGVLESSELGSLTVVTAITLIVNMGLCTIAAALGAGLRLLWWRLRGESVRGRLGISSGSSDPA